jgi:hypothetical protein
MALDNCDGHCSADSETYSLLRQIRAKFKRENGDVPCEQAQLEEAQQMYTAGRLVRLSKSSPQQR